MKTRFLFTLAIILSLGIFTNFVQNKNSEEKNIAIEFYSLKKEINQNKLKKKDFENRLVFGGTKISDINLEFISKLKKSGYKKSNLSDEKTIKISDFFGSKENGYSRYETGCKKVFRDIIVFRNEKEIIKVIKICTSCLGNELITKNKKTEVLLTFENYETLKNLISN